MVRKRSSSSTELPNEGGLVIRRGLQSLARTVSPPPSAKRRKGNADQNANKSAAAAVEAGETIVKNHLAFYSTLLKKALRPMVGKEPRISHEEWIDLYARNAGSVNGCHFVIHQHDHPIAGTHYDLRLQCNVTSSISFAIMYGLPGDPNSQRLNRNATETRVHCLWNHLIEAASHNTGSMLIWDTGEYEILPYYGERCSGDETMSNEETGSSPGEADATNQQQQLHRSFRQRKIKLRLHGTRLPAGYTLAVRLTKHNDRHEQPKKPSRRRKRDAPSNQKTSIVDSTSGKDSSEDDRPRSRRGLATYSRLESPPAPHTSESRLVQSEETMGAAASDDDDERVRTNNAYTGATNDIGSIHQRKWYLSIDRAASGFAKQVSRSSSGFISTEWVPRSQDEMLAEGDVSTPGGFERFVVGGRDTERSVVTGRLAREVLADEGVVGYTPRGLWRPITE